MAGITMRGNLPLAYVIGARMWYGDAYALYPKEYEAIFNVKKSEKMFEQFVSTVGMGMPTVKNEGQSVNYQNIDQGILNRITPITYASGFLVSMEAMRDQVDGPKVVERSSRSLANAFVISKEQLAANVLNNGFDTSVVQEGGDAKPLFSATHKLAGGGTYSNLLTAADLSEDALETAVIATGALTDDKGLLIKVTADKLIIHRNDTFNAERILKSPLRVATTDNDLNALKSTGSIPGGAHVNHYLTDTDAWFLTTSVNREGNGLVMVERSAPEVDGMTDFDTKSDKYSVIERFGLGWVDARAILGSAGA